MLESFLSFHLRGQQSESFICKGPGERFRLRGPCGLSPPSALLTQIIHEGTGVAALQSDFIYKDRRLGPGVPMCRLCFKPLSGRLTATPSNLLLPQSQCGTSAPRVSPSGSAYHVVPHFISFALPWPGVLCLPHMECGPLGRIVSFL